ncbi:MAG: PA2169 family four-helix-bundle protein [Acidimicrobiia bacterium]
MIGNPAATILEDLVETLEDGREGFQRAAEKLGDDGYPDLARRMTQFSDQRARLSAELREIALTEGIDIADEGSVVGTLHRGWMTLTDTLSGEDPHAVLAAAETGEDHAVDEFERALHSDDLPVDWRPVIVAQADAVRSAHDEVRALRDQTQ